MSAPVICTWCSTPITGNHMFAYGQPVCDAACRRSVYAARRNEEQRTDYGRYTGSQCRACEIFLDAAAVVDKAPGRDGLCAVCAGRVPAVRSIDRSQYEAAAREAR